MTPYRTLVFARIVQESALGIGGNRPHDLVDIPLARDGQGRPVIRGSTIAGCFIATARALAGTLPRAITFGGGKARQAEQDMLLPSAWRFAHAHLLGDAPQTGFFQHVSIDPRTQAAKDDHLFNLEAMPPGTCWNFELEIAPAAGADFADLEALAAATLARWRQRGGARLGRGSRHGYGWCHLEDITIVRLEARHARLWPDAFAPARSGSEWIEHFRANDAEVLELQDWLDEHAERLPKPNRHVVELSGTLQVGERQDGFGQGYGLDTLSIGGHARLQLQAQDFFDRVIQPSGFRLRAKDFDPDFTITAQPGPDGRLRPYVPGASIRGVWRAQLARHGRAQRADLTLLDTLFGNTEQAGCLSVADATLADDDWKLLWQQHVAIDELSGGAYGSSKFDRLCLAKARFCWRATIEADSGQTAQALAEPLIAMLKALGDGQLPLGGGIWRGHGHIRWTLDAATVRPLSAPIQRSQP
ncbi:RAMP superfamily CRISPR-associated protein [Thermomonas flagellata]|uniref:RAMP superfamily CRISPR-associated protein n=1 Tax=Thermomonas flagellata TaxID=2888524 RepID=UPI001F04D169|nr:RAMP superfamily CRISPR-associated protein [Thermomonas flagellata]